MPDYDPTIKVLTDEEVAAIAATVEAAIRWTNTGDKATVSASFALLLADYRRLRAKS